MRERKKGVPSDVWRFCNAACVSANLMEHKCDFTHWGEPIWDDCLLRTWSDRPGAKKLEMKLDPETDYYKIMILNSP